MPYKISQEENGYFVINTDSGEKKNKKPLSKVDAGKFMRAMYAAETKKDHSGVMLALMIPPSIAEMIAINGQELPPGVEALPPYEMHVTLCYLGDALQVDNQKLNILKAVSDYAQVYMPIAGRLNGYGRFVETHLEDTEALYLNFDSPALTAFRAGLYEMLRGIIPLEDNHGYTPHVTLAYVPDGVELEVEIPLPLEVAIDAVTVAWGEERYSFALGGALKESALSTTSLKELFSSLLDFFGFKKKTKDAPRENEFFVTKSADGQYRWVLISSNPYRDRDGEIVSLKALQADVERADNDGEYGPLRFWHVDGLDIGNTDFNMLHGKMLIEAGTFHSPEIGEAVAAKADDYQVSIGFHHPSNEPTSDGVFHNIRRFERSLVPKGRASNRFTSLAVSKGENSMSTLAEKYQAFKALLQDDELANSILQQATAKEKEADAAGVAFKEDESVVTTPDPQTITPDETPAPVDPFAALSQKLDALTQDITGMREQFTTVKDDTAARELERQTTLKAYGDKLAALETSLVNSQNETLTALKVAQKEIKLLMGDLPKGVGAFIASQAKETEIDDEDERVKSGPHQDPQNSFMSDFVFHGMPLAEQMNGK